jgi:formate-dependent phosphoribosylglycinamide formyltransferase (GAR transformylase)
MERSKALRVVKRLESQGISAQVYEGYSGRGMYGSETFGVTLDEVWMVSAAETAARTLKKAARDSLGKGVIFY